MSEYGKPGLIATVTIVSITTIALIIAMNISFDDAVASITDKEDDNYGKTCDELKYMSDVFGPSLASKEIWMSFGIAVIIGFVIFFVVQEKGKRADFKAKTT